MTRRTVAWLALLASALVSYSCGNDDSIDFFGGAPTPCFTMTVSPVPDALCAYELQFVLDASCSSDNVTPSNDLEVRWDYENDGVWDTAFGSIAANDDYRPDPADTMWTAKCQVRDRDGHVSEAIHSIPVGPFPIAPDMIAGSIQFTLSGVGPSIDTLHVGQSFSVEVYETCFGNFPSYKTVISQNGTPVDTSLDGCSGGLFSCGGGGHDGWTLQAPGTYVFRATLDFDNAYQETDEANNEVEDTLVAIP